MSEREARAHVAELDECAHGLDVARAHGDRTAQTLAALLRFRAAAARARDYLRDLVASTR